MDHRGCDDVVADLEKLHRQLQEVRASCSDQVKCSKSVLAMISDLRAEATRNLPMCDTSSKRAQVTVSARWQSSSSCSRDLEETEDAILFNMLGVAAAANHRFEAKFGAHRDEAEETTVDFSQSNATAGCFSSRPSTISAIH